VSCGPGTCVPGPSRHRGVSLGDDRQCRLVRGGLVGGLLGLALLVGERVGDLGGLLLEHLGVPFLGLAGERVVVGLPADDLPRELPADEPQGGAAQQLGLLALAAQQVVQVVVHLLAHGVGPPVQTCLRVDLAVEAAAELLGVGGDRLRLLALLQLALLERVDVLCVPVLGLTRQHVARQLAVAEVRELPLDELGHVLRQGGRGRAVAVEQRHDEVHDLLAQLGGPLLVVGLLGDRVAQLGQQRVHELLAALRGPARHVVERGVDGHAGELDALTDLRLVLRPPLAVVRLHLVQRALGRDLAALGDLTTLGVLQVSGGDLDEREQVLVGGLAGDGAAPQAGHVRVLGGQVGVLLPSVARLGLGQLLALPALPVVVLHGTRAGGVGAVRAVAAAAGAASSAGVTLTGLGRGVGALGHVSHSLPMYRYFLLSVA
jgi:hypothetical protein